MAASHTLPHPFPIPQISNLGVLTVYGYGIRITMQAGHLQIEDGIAEDRYKFRLPRVNHRLKRLVCIGDDGFITLSALRWLSEVGASFVMLDRVGKVRVVTGPVSPSEARLRRAQALALSNGTALHISRELIAAKLRGQETLLREKVRNSAGADSIAALRSRLADSADLNAVRGLESRAAAEYWDAWRTIPVLFPRKDVPLVPNHWQSFGTRHSPLTGGPRLAVNPANALLNYTNAIAESECRLAACACGLDPGLGFLHTDIANRDSLALDLIETIRPAIEAWLLDWLMREPLRKPDFSEAGDGNCRISSALCTKLSETAPTWRKLIAPWAEFVMRELWVSRSSRAQPGRDLPPTRLTQQRKREVKGSTFSAMARSPKIQRVCRGCGTHINPPHEHCKNCAADLSTKRLIEGAKFGRIIAHREKASKSRIQTKRRHDLARREWLASGQTAVPLSVYKTEIQPRLSTLTNSVIMNALKVSWVYASHIRRGLRIPHARHWRTLSELVGLRQAGYA